MHNLKYTYSVLINLIIVSIIPFLIWGPFFPDLIVSVSALYFLFYVFKNKEFYFFNNKPLIFFSPLVTLGEFKLFLSLDCCS